MKKFYCRDGQVVYVKPHPQKRDIILVIYKNKQYERSRDSIGVTLFEIDPTVVQVGSIVDLADLDTMEICLRVCICETKDKRTYRRSGGAYYGAGVVIDKVSDAVGKTAEDGIINITEFSPIGKSLINRKFNDIIEVETPEQKERYRIVGITQKA